MDFLKNINNRDHKISFDPSGIDICGNSHVNINVHNNIINIDCETIKIESDISLNELYISEKLYVRKNGFRENNIIGGIIPKGGIIIWAPPVGNREIPHGWGICDGEHHDGTDTPDLRDKFIVGLGAPSGDYSSIGDTGGSDTTILPEQALPSHAHTLAVLAVSGESSNHSHYLSGANSGSNGHKTSHSNAAHTHQYRAYLEMRGMNHEGQGNGYFQMENSNTTTSNAQGGVYQTGGANHTHPLSMTYTPYYATAPHSHTMTGTTATNPTTAIHYNSVPECYIVIYIIKL
uniref:Phage tail collar domain-containing protein n=1 Tax=viral metagenome TaxID=1070528 RepID=A0A6C0BWT5_9ZZZZ